jgi:TrmH family RNA methyltransferase
VVEPKRITSRDNPLLVRLRKLAADPAAYRKLGQIWIEGEHLCAACAASGRPVAQAVIGEAAWQTKALRELASRAAEVVLVPDALMATLSALESPSPLGFVVAWPGEGTLQPDAPSVVLDRLQDAGNVGTILRSAAAFGFRQVIALKGCAALWSPKVLRAGMGAHFGLNLIEGINADRLAELTTPLLATSSYANESLPLATLQWPCTWVFGHEGQGVAADVLARCERTLRIPQPGGEESLNVAAAAAVCLYESSRQRLGVST